MMKCSLLCMQIVQTHLRPPGTPSRHQQSKFLYFMSRNAYKLQAPVVIQLATFLSYHSQVRASEIDVAFRLNVRTGSTRNY